MWRLGNARASCRPIPEWSFTMLELWVHGNRTLVQLDGTRTTIGSAPDNDVVLDDRTVSRLHAMLERLPGGWTVRDLGSRNGTFLNGKRISELTVLRPGDRVRLGSAEAIFRGSGSGPVEGGTAPIAPAPELTRREVDVLVALCRPLAERDIFCEPASTKEIADALTVTEDAVKKHLVRLYEKFGIYEGPGSRRTRLANAALSTGAISLSSIKAGHSLDPG
jgi:DNA-binding CsgD family transcriptional regulator